MQCRLEIYDVKSDDYVGKLVSLANDSDRQDIYCDTQCFDVHTKKMDIVTLFVYVCQAKYSVRVR